MKKIHIALSSVVILVILTFVTVAKGIGGGVAAAEDERFRMNGTTLTRYVGTETFVTLPDTIRAIGEGAFSGNETMTGIELPSSLDSIAYNAFKDCTALTGVIIPDSVTKIGPGAFEGCTALTSVEIGENVSSWGTGVFTNCDSLAKISVDKDNQYITYYNGAVYNGNMTMLYQVLPGRQGENYVMPDTVRDIDAYALWNLQNTKNVKVSSAVNTIPKYALTNMGSVENVAIQNTTSTIAERALADNANLKQVAVPASVNTIDRNAFSGSPDMKIFTAKSSTADTFGNKYEIEVIYQAEYPDDFLDSNVDLEERPNVGQNTGNNNVPTNSNSTSTSTNNTTNNNTGTNNSASSTPSVPEGFQGIDGYIHPLDVPESDDVIGKAIIVAGRAVVLANNHDMKVYGIPEGIHADVMTEQQYKDSQEQENTAEGETSISVNYQRENNTEIAQRKYYKQKDLTSYEIDKEVKSIGRLAFAESGLKAINIPMNVTEIEYGAFMGCTELEEVAIPSSVSGIGTKAFEGSAWLSNWRNNGNSDFLIVGDGILIAYKGTDAHVQIPEGVKQIGPEVFKGHTEIFDVAVPASVTKICAEAFRNCSALTGLTGCEGLRTVIRGAFYGTQLSETEFLK